MDTKKLYSTNEFYSGITTLKTVIQDRRETLLQNAEVNQPVPEILSVITDVIQDTEGQALQVVVQVGDTVPVADVALYVADSPYGQFTAYPMLEDSTNQYSLTLPVYSPGTVLRYYAQATAADDVGTLVFSPEGAEHEVYTYVVTYAQATTSSVVINELMAGNDTTLADPQGDFNDWIELFNMTDEAVDLSGMYLSDNPENPLKWEFPDGTVIDAGGYVLVWADEDGGDEGLHANFKLSADGETVWLYDTDTNQNALLDTVTFTAQTADQSIGRVPNGGDEWQVLTTPSPLAENQ